MLDARGASTLLVRVGHTLIVSCGIQYKVNNPFFVCVGGGGGGKSSPPGLITGLNSDLGLVITNQMLLTLMLDIRTELLLLVVAPASVLY